MDLSKLAVSVDENGNPFLILKDQESKTRLRGFDAQKSNILAAKSVADTLRTSLGPKGMDKIIVGPDGDVTVTNDGATILDKMDVEHQCAKLLVELSKSQDEQIGDGTTGVIVLAGALLDQALLLLEKGIHPCTIYDGFEMASQVCINRIKEISKSRIISDNNYKVLREAAETALSSKVVSSERDLLAKISVDAIISVADIERKTVNFDMIKIQPTPTGQLKDSQLVYGLVLDKEMSHPQMDKQIDNAKIAILTCPFEPPKPKTKHKLDITSAQELRQLQDAEHKYFTNMIKCVKDSGATFIACQWGFDDEANHLLYSEKLPAIRWVGGVELEMLAIATKGKIVGRFEDLNADKLGNAICVKEINSGSDNQRFVRIDNGKECKSVTIILHGGNSIVLSEAHRSVHDALCVIRNLIADANIVPGGGASEIAAAIAVELAGDKHSNVNQLIFYAFSEALLAIPMSLAENSGVNSLDTVLDAKRSHTCNNNPNIGIDCFRGGSADMMEMTIHESLESKIHQVQLATQAVRMILKIDDIIAPSDI